nr:bifunctional diaminohydroxyphosphoribosylaminopyrimidine deaminase/5-amino-6-(5-phosphoribosylamino)uracil reductase RibD [Caldanaerobius polysaccharolyticus]
MEQALKLAAKGWGLTNPNPLVGAVIVKDGKIIGEGYHQKIGGPHAEINALEDARKKGHDVTGSTLYVNLEPCSHYGRTPPCSEAIIKAGIKEVYVGMKDPNPRVSGRGIKMLQDAGIEVNVGILEKEAIKLNEIFIKYITTKMPFVIMKAAMSIDGKIATFTGDSKWITSETSREYVRRIRGKVASIMVGVNTVIKDDPLLTTRIEGLKDPMKIIIDSYGRTPLNSNVLKSGVNTIIFTTDLIDKNKLSELKKYADVIVLKAKSTHVPLKKVMEYLGQMEIDSVLLEGGGTLNWSAVKDGIVDKVMFFISPMIIGGVGAKTPVEGNGFETINQCLRLKNITVTTVDTDILLEGYF